MSIKVYDFRADFISKEDRDTARMALDGQDVFWDGTYVGKVRASYKTDDTSLGLSIEVEQP